MTILNSARQKIAFWLLKTNREEVKRQFRRVEQKEGRGTELIQCQFLLGIDWGEKPEPYKVDLEHENYVYRWRNTDESSLVNLVGELSEEERLFAREAIGITKEKDIQRHNELPEWSDN